MKYVLEWSNINTRTVWIGLSFLCSMYTLSGQDSKGGEIFTKESYLFGRFEVVMQSAEGDGIVSSFFLYNTEVGANCTWPAENNEIDVEMTVISNPSTLFLPSEPAMSKLRMVSLR